ncbi:hypothetical protein LTR37_008052 [Vermiconidia calcicola]|uniref:Uncharacterized protein n=1 Tax=Vermiconidia calcicola TaxID=1690605 RepID=A0ACC3NBN8_9PEZI|nr:hypothetical protein LTR37_008052 [Vermiconidia calcicola]
MAQAPDISVARAVLVSALLRSEPGTPELSRDDATLFARTILRTCNICTTSNIKLCRTFILQHVLVSSARTSALAKYLVNLSKSCCPKDTEYCVDTSKSGDESEGLGNTVGGRIQQPPDPSFIRLHILYIVHDVLTHYRIHTQTRSRSIRGYLSDEVLDLLRPDVCKLAELAACQGGGKAPNTCQSVLDLLTFWSKYGILNQNHVDQMHDRALQAAETEWDAMLTKLAKDDENKVEEERRQKESKSKWMVPDRHGVANDPTAPWHELPAANGLYLKRTRGYPLRATALPVGGTYLPDGGDEADPQLQKDVRSLYDEVIRCYDKYTNAEEVQDVDALGNIIWKDPDRATRNYWGFTLDGIDRRKELAERFAETATGYDDSGAPYRVENAVDRARALAAERGRGIGRGRGRGGGLGWRSGRRW